MKVYLVFYEGDFYDGGDVLQAVYSTLDAAQAAVIRFEQTNHPRRKKDPEWAWEWIGGRYHPTSKNFFSSLAIETREVQDDEVE